MSLNVNHSGISGALYESLLRESLNYQYCKDAISPNSDTLSSNGASWGIFGGSLSFEPGETERLDDFLEDSLTESYLIQLLSCSKIVPSFVWTTALKTSREVSFNPETFVGITYPELVEAFKEVLSGMAEETPPQGALAGEVVLWSIVVKSIANYVVTALNVLDALKSILDGASKDFLKSRTAVNRVNSVVKYLVPVSTPGVLSDVGTFQPTISSNSSTSITTIRISGSRPMLSVAESPSMRNSLMGGTQLMTSLYMLIKAGNYTASTPMMEGIVTNLTALAHSKYAMESIKSDPLCASSRPGNWDATSGLQVTNTPNSKVGFSYGAYQAFRRMSKLRGGMVPSLHPASWDNPLNGVVCVYTPQVDSEDYGQIWLPTPEMPVTPVLANVTLRERDKVCQQELRRVLDKELPVMDTLTTTEHTFSDNGHSLFKRVVRMARKTCKSIGSPVQTPLDADGRIVAVAVPLNRRMLTRIALGEAFLPSDDPVTSLVISERDGAVFTGLGGISEHSLPSDAVGDAGALILKMYQGLEAGKGAQVLEAVGIFPENSDTPRNEEDLVASIDFLTSAARSASLALAGTRRIMEGIRSVYDAAVQDISAIETYDMHNSYINSLLGHTLKSLEKALGVATDVQGCVTAAEIWNGGEVVQNVVGVATLPWGITRGRSVQEVITNMEVDFPGVDLTEVWLSEYPAADINEDVGTINVHDWLRFESRARIALKELAPEAVVRNSVADAISVLAVMDEPLVAAADDLMSFMLARRAGKSPYFKAFSTGLPHEATEAVTGEMEALGFVEDDKMRSPISANFKLADSSLRCQGLYRAIPSTVFLSQRVITGDVVYGQRSYGNPGLDYRGLIPATVLAANAPDIEKIVSSMNISVGAIRSENRLFGINAYLTELLTSIYLLGRLLNDMDAWVMSKENKSLVSTIACTPVVSARVTPKVSREDILQEDTFAPITTPSVSAKSLMGLGHPGVTHVVPIKNWMLLTSLPGGARYLPDTPAWRSRNRRLAVAHSCEVFVRFLSKMSPGERSRVRSNLSRLSFPMTPMQVFVKSPTGIDYGTVAEDLLNVTFMHGSDADPDKIILEPSGDVKVLTREDLSKAGVSGRCLIPEETSVKVGYGITLQELSVSGITTVVLESAFSTFDVLHKFSTWVRGR